MLVIVALAAGLGFLVAPLGAGLVAGVELLVVVGLEVLELVLPAVVPVLRVAGQVVLRLPLPVRRFLSALGASPLVLHVPAVSFVGE